MSQPSMRIALDNYIETGEGDMMDIIEGKKHPPIFGPIEMGRYLKAQLGGSLFHDTTQDASYLPEAYNKGDDWFEATLGEPMVDIGAGWGRLSNHLASKGANVTGVLMASDQQNYAQRLNKKLGYDTKSSPSVDIKLVNFFNLDKPKGYFNVISSVEMAEHVGI